MYANYGSDADVAFFTTNMKNFGGFEMITFLSNYIKFAKRCETYAPALTAARDIESLARERFTKNGAAKGLKDLVTIWTQKESDMKAKVDAAKKENKDTAALEKDLKTISETKDIIAGLLKGLS